MRALCVPIADLHLYTRNMTSGDIRKMEGVAERFSWDIAPNSPEL